jgi:hypothetical protein
MEFFVFPLPYWFLILQEERNVWIHMEAYGIGYEDTEIK